MVPPLRLPKYCPQSFIGNKPTLRSTEASVRFLFIRIFQSTDVQSMPGHSQPGGECGRSLIQNPVSPGQTPKKSGGPSIFSQSTLAHVAITMLEKSKSALSRAEGKSVKSPILRIAVVHRYPETPVFGESTKLSRLVP